MKRLLSIVLTFVAFALSTQAAIPFRVVISGDFNVPTFTIFNDAPTWKGTNAQITRLTINVGDVSRNFDFVDSIVPPPGGTVTAERPDAVNEGVIADMLILNITGFDPGESFRFRADIDADGNFYTGEDFRRVLFNNGSQANSEVTAHSGGQQETITMADGPADLTSYTFSSTTQMRVLTVRSLAEAGGTEYVSRAAVKINGEIGVDTSGRGTTNIGQIVTIHVADGDTVEISAPQEVYKNIHGVDITDSADNDPNAVQKDAEERFTAIGISVNDLAQTGDPTLYTFQIAKDTQVVVKWRHDYALTVRQDFTDTVAMDGAVVWAGPMASFAAGNPEPAVQKTWHQKNKAVIAQIDGQVVSFERPGLSIRYVPKAYRVYGPPNTQVSPLSVNTDRRAGIDIRTNAAHFQTNIFAVGQSPPQRQQVNEFIMYAPAGVTYVWQIQFGVEVNIDDATRAGLPRIFQNQNTTNWTALEGSEGIFWFNPGAKLRVASAAHLTDPNSTALNGWLGGDGFYFSNSGDINTIDGSLLQGGPVTRNNAPVAIWRSNILHAAKLYRGLEINQLQRPAKVLWRYGPPAIATSATLGQHVFQNEPANANLFTNPPIRIEVISISGLNTNVPESEITIWDPAAARLFPLVPGQFKALWRPGSNPNATPVTVIVNAKYPIPAHYPHLIHTPAVALDPDPTDDFTFKQIRYTENNAAIDGNNHFTAAAKGKTVLLFGHIQRGGRGLPREFLAVRVVDSRDYQTPAITVRDAIIGQKIQDPGLDRAKLGTGFATSLAAIEGATPARPPFNQFIYDVQKLTGLAAKDIYYPGTNIVAHPENLPGPIIPVNLLPNAPRERILVVWYADPATHDRLLWPHAARYYNPVWPVTTNEGLGQIVIASQLGSESLDINANDQIVVEGLTTLARDPGGVVIATNTIPAETIYNPARLQQVQIYNQPNRSLPGYNPNEEHALIAPSLRFAEVSPRPPAIYALRHNDINVYNPSSLTDFQQGADYTSHPFVLVQFFDTAANEFKMRVYEVAREQGTRYRFAATNKLTATTSSRDLLAQPHVTMEAGEPVIPFYPLGVVIGASPCSATFGSNIKPQTTYWEDHKGTAWAVSGGTDAWFTVSFHYPLAPDFWWPSGKSGFISPSGTATVPQDGDCVSFLPVNIKHLLALSADTPVPDGIQTSNRPTRILYKSDWPAIAPVLKAGETLTFSGGEFRADNPTMQILGDDGEPETIQTPGLPGVLAFATAEVVFDSLNPLARSNLWEQSWTARIAQVLEQRLASLPINNFPSSLTPATGRTRVKEGKYVFNELPASLQKRFRYDPIVGRLELFGLLNDKDIGDPTLTASPPAVYVLEPNILTPEEAADIKALDASGPWQTAVQTLFDQSRDPADLQGNGYFVGLEPAIIRDANGNPIAPIQRDRNSPAPFHAFGPGLALLPNAGFLDPKGVIPGTSNPYPEISWVTVAENNDPNLGGSPITLHIIKVDRRHRYRGAIKTVLSDNVFDENIVLRHTGDFGANADLLFFEWWYRPDDGSLNVPPPDLLRPGQPNPWKLFPDPSGRRGQGRFQMTLKGNPNTPEVLLADSWWFCRYRHTNDTVAGTDWNVPQTDGSSRVNFTWAGAGNSDPFNDFDLDDIPDYRAQLAQGWIKRVLDAVNPYEARIRDFNGDNPATKSSMLAQFGARFEGPVALNPAKDVIENVGLIELYETILKRGRDFSIDLSRPVSTPAIANALQLASTRLADFYTILGNEAYVDAQDPTIGFGSASIEYGSLAPATFAFQNQMSSLLEEELGLLRGVDDFFARPVYNRLFWNFTKAEGEPAYAMNYNISDINQDGFIDEDDAMILYPQGHGDAWGHYLTAIRHQYDLLRHPFFNWVSRSEFYNLQDIVIKVDFLDERKFAQVAAAKAKTASEIVNITYREKYVEDPAAQWQGYTDSNKDRAWGVQEWARRTAQGAYFDWVTANALLPAVHPNENLEGVQKVDREANSDIPVISANLNAIQNTFDQANKGQNPLGHSSDVVPFDISPQLIDDLIFGKTHFEQIYERAIKALENAVAIWDNANESRNRLRQVANSELEFRNDVFQQDLSYRNQLIKLFGKPYAGTIGSGKLYPAGYDGPDLLLYMYVNVREINDNTVPGPTTAFATFTGNTVTAGDIFRAFEQGEGNGFGGSPSLFLFKRQTLGKLVNVANDVRRLFSPSFAPNNANQVPVLVRDGLYAVNYTDLNTPKVDMENLTELMPVTAAGYTFQAPPEWGARLAVGDLQLLINKMLQQEAQIASAIGAWDALQGAIVREMRIINAKLDMSANLRDNRESFSRWKLGILELLKGIDGSIEVYDALQKTVEEIKLAGIEIVPDQLPTGGLAISPGDALGAADAAIVLAGSATKAGIHGGVAAFKIAKLVIEAGVTLAENELQIYEKREEDVQTGKEMLKALENLVGDEPIKRIAIFKEIQALREQSDQYRAMLDEGTRLIDERAAFNKRVAAQTQRNRYQDMTFRVSRNHALQTYRAAFDLAARYAYLTAKAYDYETNFEPSNPHSPTTAFGDIIRARGIGHFDGDARFGKGGLAEVLAWLKAHYDLLKGQLGINNPQFETGKISLRTELFRIQPSGPNTPTSDNLWRNTLQQARVADLWLEPEFRYFCRPFASESDASGNHVPEPGIVLRFGTQITPGQNLFGKPLGGGDQAYDPSVFATKIRSVGIWFSDYLSEDVSSDLPAAPRIYLFPVGADIMSVPYSDDPSLVRLWKVVDERIPAPLPAIHAPLDNANWIPLLDSLEGRFGDPRKFSMFRAYHDGSSAVNLDELVADGRLIGRSVRNTRWLLIIPGRVLNADPDAGLDRFIDQVTDIKMVFQTYGYSGN